MSELFRTIEPWAEAWGSNLWRASWQGGLVIVAALAITRWCTFLSPRFACWIWRLACIKLLVGLICVQPVAIPIFPSGSPPILTAGNESRELAATQAEIAAMRVSPEAWPVTANDKPPVSPATHGNWNWLLALWIVGVGYRVSLTVRQWKSVRRLCRSAQPVQSTALQDLCRHVADRMGIRQLPPIRFSSHTNVPLLAGVWRPMILLPAGALEEFDDCELRLMLGHEMAHLKRRDLLWNWLPTVVSWLFFYHPLIWILPRRWSEALEAACDELLIQSDSTGAAACGRLLVKLAARWPGEQRAQLMAAGVLGTYRDLERRILAMARVKPISRRSLIIAAGTASLVAALGIIPWRLVAQEPKTDKTATPHVAIGEAPDQGHGQWLGAGVKSSTPHIIIAEHVLLWDNRIVTWDEVVTRLRVMRLDGPFRASFHFTNGVNHKDKEGWRFWNDRIMSLYGELFAPVGVTLGSLSPRGSQKFDAVHTQDHLQPNPAHALTGRLLTPDGKPAARAQVLVLPSKGTEVILNGTDVYEPLDEQWAPTDETGGFTVYPDGDDYWIAALHPSGFILERGPVKGADLAVQLQPWAVVTFSSAGEVAGQHAALSISPIGAGANWPRFNANPFKTKGKPIDVKVPAGKIVAQQFLEMKEGVSIAAPQADTFSLGPGEQRTLAIAPADARERAAATAAFEEMQARSRPRSKTDGKSGASPQPPSRPAASAG
jgi:beta-lactamase regulating signal transducer with metallopeptidase domain